jgi:hypothetical protein
MLQVPELVIGELKESLTDQVGGHRAGYAQRGAGEAEHVRVRTDAAGMFKKTQFRL